MHKDISPDDFRDLVASDVRGLISKEDAMWLRTSEVIDDFYDTLVLLSRNVDLQFARKKSETFQKATEFEHDSEGLLEYRKASADWKVKTLRFKQAIEERISECRKIRRTGISKDLVPVAGLELLIKAIESHRSRIDSDDDQAVDETADEELWSVLTKPSVETLKVLVNQVG